MTSIQGDTHHFDALNENTSPRLSEVTIQELLANRRCRAILRYLEAKEGPAEIEAMIEHLTRQENDAYPSDTAAELSNQVATAVWTVHLPALATHDIVRYDRESGMVRWGCNAGRLTAYLEDPLESTIQEE